MSYHEIKRNDTRPFFAVATAYDDGTLAPLDGVISARFIAREVGNGQVKIDAQASITAASLGELEYRFVEGDTDQAGDFDCEWEITYSDGSIQTFPVFGFDRLVVLGDLA